MHCPGVFFFSTEQTGKIRAYKEISAGNSRSQAQQVIHRTASQLPVDFRVGGGRAEDGFGEGEFYFQFFHVDSPFRDCKLV